MDRIHPFRQVFGPMADERFPAIRDAAAGERAIEPLLMCRPMMDLLHDLRPDTGLGESVDDFVAFVHACYLYWCDGAHDTALDESTTLQLVRDAVAGVVRGEPPNAARYVQVHPRLLWTRPESSEIHEPIDGWFAVREGTALRMVACIGVHPARPGLSVMVVRGERPDALGRTPPYAPEMEGGAAAGLVSVATVEEMLALGWQAGE
jgi:hypothetical protein